MHAVLEQTVIVAPPTALRPAAPRQWQAMRLHAARCLKHLPEGDARRGELSLLLSTLDSCERCRVAGCPAVARALRAAADRYRESAIDLPAARGW